FSILSPNYLPVSNMLTISSQVAIYALLAIGQLLVILNGGIDLSVGSTLGLSGMVAGFLMQGVRLNSFGVILYPQVWVVVIASCLVGVLVGLINGVVVSTFQGGGVVCSPGLPYL